MKYLLFVFILGFMGCPPFEEALLGENNSGEKSVVADDSDVANSDPTDPELTDPGEANSEGVWALEGSYSGGTWDAYVNIGLHYGVDDPVEPIKIEVDSSGSTLTITLPSFSGMSTIPSITYKDVKVVASEDGFSFSKEACEFEVVGNEGESKKVNLKEFYGAFENGKFSLNLEFIYGSMPFPFVCNYNQPL